MTATRTQATYRSASALAHSLTLNLNNEEAAERENANASLSVRLGLFDSRLIDDCVHCLSSASYHAAICGVTSPANPTSTTSTTHQLLYLDPEIASGP